MLTSSRGERELALTAALGCKRAKEPTWGVVRGRGEGTYQHPFPLQLHLSRTVYLKLSKEGAVGEGKHLPTSRLLPKASFFKPRRWGWNTCPSPCIWFVLTVGLHLAVLRHHSCQWSGDHMGS